MRRKLVVVVMLMCLPSLAYAGQGDDLSREANNLLRQAENSFFAGKIEESGAVLDQAAAKLNALRAQDPGHKSINTLATKYERLKKRVDEKTAKPATVPAAVSAPTADQPAGASPQLSSGAVQTLTNVGKEMDSAEASLAQAEESLGEKDFNKFGTRLYKAEDYLSKAKGLLERAERSYKIGPAHSEAKPLYQRYGELEKQIAAAKQDGESRKGRMAEQKQQAAEMTTALDEKWIPRLEEFIRPTGARYIDYPMTHDLKKLAEQDRTLEAAKRLLAGYEQEVPAGSAGTQLERAAANLRSAIENYSHQRNAGVGDLRGTIEGELAQWEKRFEENKGWKQDSDRSLFALSPEKIKGVHQQIERLKAMAPSEAEAFFARLAKLEKENGAWVEKRTAWENRPRPFPEAKMTSKALEKEMAGLLADRGWKVERLVIVDKDWWVLKGEYRYMQAAALSKDGEGPFWSYVSFKQNQTLAGYGPTELWEAKKKIRLP